MSELKVIGAGLGRTGTTSLKLALEHLLGAPCFHFLEFGTHPELMQPWLDFVNRYDRYEAADGAFHVPGSTWRELLPGYVACVDEPASYYWRQLSRTYPDALVILSVRDAQSWFDSVSHVHKIALAEAANLQSLDANRKAFVEFLLAMYPGLGPDLNPTSEMAFFNSHNNKVCDYAKGYSEFSKRLVVWEASEGWEPICNALGVSVPDLPFPHQNKRHEYHGY